MKSKMTEVKGVICYRYYRGIDGRGTCDTDCQWWIDGFACPFWVDEEEWEEKQDRWQKGITIEEFAKNYGIEIRVGERKRWK